MSWLSAMEIVMTILGRHRDTSLVLHGGIELHWTEYQYKDINYAIWPY